MSKTISENKQSFKNYKKDALVAARELGYGTSAYIAIEKAKNEVEVDQKKGDTIFCRSFAEREYEYNKKFRNAVKDYSKKNSLSIEDSLQTTYVKAMARYMSEV